ncbi:hypothetical protein ZHAS_00006127 [Anopheles sinensis]|uniref:Secreted protein n=1 Tax=Anopheles sinensis TaxID=74873 RepID=A0A084VL85_ANOSI|nr:hypothetical protein ZHAS_00006127 [Anopheles sinensis]
MSLVLACVAIIHFLCLLAESVFAQHAIVCSCSPLRRQRCSLNARETAARGNGWDDRTSFAPLGVVIKPSSSEPDQRRRGCPAVLIFLSAARAEFSDPLAWRAIVSTTTCRLQMRPRKPFPLAWGDGSSLRVAPGWCNFRFSPTQRGTGGRGC